MVTIIEGCNKNCTFCIVPKTRGPERSRPSAEILGEVRHLLDYGFQEIELLGQTVNHWREPGGDWDFADLLDADRPHAGRAAAALRHLLPARLHAADGGAGGASTPTSAPTCICPCSPAPTACCAAWGAATPAASTSTSSASSAGRGPTWRSRPTSSSAFRARPRRTSSSTLELVREVRFAAMYAFKYSPRPGTAAPRLSDPVDPEVASERLQRLFQLQDGIQREINRELVGKELEVIVTGWGKQPGTQTGRTPCHRVVHFDDRPRAGSPGQHRPASQVETALAAQPASAGACRFRPSSSSCHPP